MTFEHERRRSSARRRIGLLLLGFGLLVGCGTLGASDDQAKGDANLPLSGVGPFMKQYIDCDAETLEPIFLTSGRHNVLYEEPLLVEESESRFMVFFERRVNGLVGRRDVYVQRIEIVRAPESEKCKAWNVRLLSPQGNEIDKADPVLVLKNAGAPCVIKAGGVYQIWYSVSNDKGIGYAEVTEQADGSFAVTRAQSVVLTATEDWENGRVGSPSVLNNPYNGKYQMWYEGSPYTRRSIGYAEYDNATNAWIKSDAAGRNSVDNPGSVMPVLWPDQIDWEFHYPRDLDSGTVGTPNVILFQSPARTFYYMYYTGNLTGWPKPGPVKAPLEKGTLMLLNDQGLQCGLCRFPGRGDLGEGVYDSAVEGRGLGGEPHHQRGFCRGCPGQDLENPQGLPLPGQDRGKHERVLPPGDCERDGALHGEPGDPVCHGVPADRWAEFQEGDRIGRRLAGHDGLKGETMNVLQSRKSPTAMKVLLSLLLCFFLSVVASCGDDDWVCNSLCVLDTGPAEVTALWMNVQLRGFATGDGVFEEIQYLDNSTPEQQWRTVEKANMFPPWAEDLVYTSGMQVHVKATGKLENGTLEVRFFQDRNPDGFEGSDMCQWMCSM